MSIATLFEEQVDKTPNGVALLYRKHKKTFCLYNSHANKPLARFCISPSVVSEVELLEYREFKKGKDTYRV